MIINDDCIKYLSKMESNSVDLILTDPPYEISKYSTGDIHLPNRKKLNNHKADWDKVFNPAKYASELIRVLKNDGNMFIFTSYNLIGKWHELLDTEFDTFQYFVWHKTNPPPKIYRNGFLNSCELIICLWNKKDNCVFTGDTMFVGRTGRTIDKKSNIEDLYNSIYNTILLLPENTQIYPGHHYGFKKKISIKENIICSDFFRCKTFIEFIKIMEKFESNK